MPEWLLKLLRVSEGSRAASDVPLPTAAVDRTGVPNDRSRLQEALATRPQRSIGAPTPPSSNLRLIEATRREEAADRAGIGPLYRGYRHFQAEISPYLSFGVTALPGIRKVRGNAPADVKAMREAGVYPRSQDAIPIAATEAAILGSAFAPGMVRKGVSRIAQALSKARSSARVATTLGERALQSRVSRGLSTVPSEYSAPLMELPNSRAAVLPKGAPEVLGGGVPVPRESSWLDLALYLGDRAEYGQAAKMLRRTVGGRQ